MHLVCSSEKDKKKISYAIGKINLTGLKIMAGQRTMTGQNKHLTGQTSFEN